MSRAVFEATLLPDEMRLDLCRSILAEAGVENVRVNTSTKELLHRCAMPWHDDRNPSASLNWEKMTYWCFSCSSGGGLLWLIRVIRGGSHADARRWVSDESGIEGGEYDLSAMLTYLDALWDAPVGQGRVIPSFSTRALDPWNYTHPWLTDPVEDGGRGVPVENVERMQVGYAERYPMGKDEDGDPLPPSERIVVPHFWKGKLVGWQSRRLADDGTPKWLSTPDLPKDVSLYSTEEVLKGDTLVVVESPMTALRHIHHLPIAATFGASVTDSQIRLMADFDRVILWMDPDKAGWQSIEGYTDDTGTRHAGCVERLERFTDVWTVMSDWAVDGADMDDETAASVVAEAEPAVLWERPTALRCWDCKQYHSGDCREEV